MPEQIIEIDEDGKVTYPKDEKDERIAKLEKQLVEANKTITLLLEDQEADVREGLQAAREIILNFTRACNKEHVRRGDWAGGVMAEEHTAECMSHKDALSWEYEYKCDCGVEDRQEIKQLKAKVTHRNLLNHDLEAANMLLRDALDTIKHEARYRLNSSKDDTWALVYNKAVEVLKITGREKGQGV